MNFYQKWCVKKAKIKKNRLHKFYKKNDTILDVGSGNCGLVLLTKKANFNISALDIKNKSAFAEITPKIYKGKELPFKDNRFDIVQLITVLHHIKTPEETVKESIRVGKKIIIMEDIYSNIFQKIITYIVDSIINWEFFGHPHSNKTDTQWKAIFEKNNLEIEHVEYYQFLLFFKQVTYVLKKK